MTKRIIILRTSTSTIRVWDKWTTNNANNNINNKSFVSFSANSVCRLCGNIFLKDIDKYVYKLKFGIQ